MNHLKRPISEPRILAVEDDDCNRELIRIVLGSEFHVTLTSTGEQALVLAAGERFDLVIMDIHLGPGIDGVETMKRLRSFDGYQSTAFIAVTAFAMKGDREQLLGLGFHSYLSKPYLTDELREAVRSLLQH